MNELQAFKEFLLGLLTEARELDKRAKGTAHVAIEANIRLLERMAMFVANSIKVGTLDMDKAKAEIKVVDEGTIESLGRARSESPITIKIKEIAAKLKPGAYRKLDADGIDYTDFSTRVYNLRADDKLPQEVKPKNLVNGEKGIFLVKLTKEQMSAEPKRSPKNA